MKHLELIAHRRHDGKDSPAPQYVVPTETSTSASIAGCRRRPLCTHLASPSSAANRLLRIFLSCYQSKTPRNFHFPSGLKI